MLALPAVAARGHARLSRLSVAAHDLAGVTGVVLIAGTYLAVQTGRLRIEDVAYSLLNALGALLVLVSLAFDFNLASFLVEAFWLAISVYGLFWRPRPGPGGPAAGAGTGRDRR